MIIDLTHTLKIGITVYPGTPETSFEQLSTIEKDGFTEKSIHLTTHSGTHIDAPCHILPGTRSLDEFPLEKFIGRGVVMDCSSVNTINRTFLQSCEIPIQQVEFVLFYTGWQQKWNTPQYFRPFPVLTPDATEWLLTFNLKALGFDTISVDRMDDATLSNHHLLLQKEMLIIENMNNLDQLLNKYFELYCIPLKIKEADASPVRVFARTDDK